MGKKAMEIKLVLFCCVLSLMDYGHVYAQSFTYPLSDGSTTVSLAENTPLSTSVLTMTTAGFASTPTYSITLGNTGSHFIISGSTIRTNTAALDYETTSSYALTVQATYGASSASAVFTVLLQDVNDERPQLAASGNVYTNTVDEELALGTKVLGPFSITDKDAGDSPTFSLSGSHASYFNIDPALGVVTIGQRLDYDTLAFDLFDQLYLQVRDKGGNTLTSAQALSVTIRDINDNSPTCSPSLYSITVPEDTAVATTVTTLTCTDGDKTSGIGTISNHSIASGDDTPAKFSVTGASVKIGASLNYEARTSYTLLLDVVDGGTPAKTGTATVQVFVSNVNEFAPAWGTFTPPGTSFSLLESAALGTSLVRLTATDNDAGVLGQVTYRVVSTTAVPGGPVSGVFQVDASSGQVITTATLDREVVSSYSLVVSASDGGSPAMSVTTTLTVTVTDVNDNAPMFSPTSYSFPVGETAARGNTWAGGQLTATDADTTGGPLVYQVAGGDTLNKFRFSSTTQGLLLLNAAIDVDKPTANPTLYLLTVQVTDPGIPPLTGSATVTVTINAFSNDHSPVFGTPVPSASPNINENVAVGTTVATVTATDNDVVSSVAQTVTYTITGGNTNNDFAIDTSLGVVYTARALDYETTTSYTLQITATDNGTPPRLSTSVLSVTVVNINEHTPACPAYTVIVSVTEAVTPQPATVTTLGCTDSDSGDSLTYSILPANPSFTIPASGQLSTILPLDYEASTTHTLLVKVQDSLTPVRSVTVTVTVQVQPVNEHSPVFAPATYTTTLAEDVVAGTTVTTVTATDADRGANDGTIRYSIVSGNGLGAFTVSSSTGLITTTSVGLDRETQSTHTLGVSACDDIAGAATERCVTATVIVSVTDVNDNAPQCVPQNYQARVTEPSVVGAVVATLTAVDDDEAGTPNATPTFSVTAGDVLPPNTYFSTSGNNLLLSREVDYESQTSFVLTIKVADGGAPALSSTCQVTVTIISTDEFPPLTLVPNYSMTLPETTATGTLVYKVNATDSDKGNGSVIRYDIVSGNTNSDFFCYPDSGSVVVWNALDFDTPPQTYNLTIAVSDDGGLATSFWLYVQLTDANDQTPVFSKVVYSVPVVENVALGTEVVRLTAVDTDSGTAGIVTYVAVSGDGTGLFSVHPGTGAVTTNATIDREARHSYSLLVRAADGGTPSLSSITLVDIIVSDLNDNVPVFSPQAFTISVSENSAVGTSVTTVTARDADTSVSNNVFTYVLTDTHFQVDSASGVVSVKQILDRETQNTHVLEILAPDAGVPPLTGTATVTVVVDDVNDNSPVVIGTYSLLVSEAAAVGSMATTISANDADTGDNARLTFSIIAGNTDNDFFISSTGGYIQVRNKLDRERTPRYDIAVKVTDNGSTLLSATATVTITITDVNDNSPVFGSKPYSFTVAENLAAGQNVGQVTATDADGGINADLVYSIVLLFTGNNNHFALDGATGTITTTTPLDREATAQYVAWIRVTDNGVPQLHDDVNVTIAVSDLNDNAPYFNRLAYNASVRENSAVGTGVLTVTAGDADIGNNALLTLAIDTSTTQGQRAQLFLQVTSGTGVLSVKSLIDRETDSVFTFALLAYDAGTPSMTSSASVTVSIIDVNDNAPSFTRTYYNTAIAYAAQCTRSVATVSATDLDTGLNGQVTYFLSAAASPFLLDAVTGELTVQSALTAHVMYWVNVSARDDGSPVMTSAAGVLVRVDAFVPSQVVVTFRLGITAAAFLPLQDVFLAQLQVIMRQQYPTAVAKLWCTETNDNGLADVHVYFLSDNSTEVIANSNAAKYYISQSDARGAYTSQPSGVPNAALSGAKWSAYDIQFVLPYLESQTPFAETAAGIGIIAACCVVGLGVLVAAVYMGARFCRQQGLRTKGRPKRRILVEEPARTSVPPVTYTKPRPPASLSGSSVKPRPMGNSGENNFFWNSSA